MVDDDRRRGRSGAERASPLGEHVLLRAAPNPPGASSSASDGGSLGVQRGALSRADRRGDRHRLLHPCELSICDSHARIWSMSRATLPSSSRREPTRRRPLSISVPSSGRGCRPYARPQGARAVSHQASGCATQASMRALAVAARSSTVATTLRVLRSPAPFPRPTERSGVKMFERWSPGPVATSSVSVCNG